MKTFSSLVTSLVLSILLFGCAHGAGKSHKADVRKPWFDEGPVIRVGAKENWEVTCRNGAHVKLLAIGTKHLGPDPIAEPVSSVEGVYWVDPEGRQTGPYLDYLSTRYGDLTKDDSKEPYEFVARIAGEGTLNPRDWSLFAEPTAGNGFCFSDTQIPKDQVYVVDFLPKDFYVSDVGLLISAGPWITILEASPDAKVGWKTTFKERGSRAVRLEPPAMQDGELHASVVHHIERGKAVQYHLFAVDSNGKEYRLQSVVGDRTPEGERDTYALPVALTDVRKLQFRVRLCEHVEFKNVALRPAPDPSAKRGTLSEEARKKVLEAGRAEGWKVAFQLAPEVRLDGVSCLYAENAIFGWWSPEGIPLSEEPKLDQSSFVKEEDCISYRLALDARPTQHSVRLRVETEPASPPRADQELWNYRRKQYNSINHKGYMWCRLKFPSDITSCNVRIGAAGGDFEDQPFEAARSARGRWMPESMDTPAGRIGLERVEEKDGVSQFTVNYALKDMDLHMLVFSKEGKPLTSEETSFGVRPDGTRTMVVRVDAPKSDIRKVRFQTRPFEWALYHDVALRPRNSGEAKGK